MKAVLIPGDGIGREIAESVREVSAALNTGIEWQEFAAGAEYAAESGELIAPGTLDAIEACGWALKGPTATPIGKGFRSINVQLRQRFSTYANLRPVHTLPGVPTRFDNVDLVIVRENTEDLYKGIEYMLNDEIANGVKLIYSKPDPDDPYSYAYGETITAPDQEVTFVFTRKPGLTFTNRIKIGNTPFIRLPSTTVLENNTRYTYTSSLGTITNSAIRIYVIGKSGDQMSKRYDAIIFNDTYYFEDVPAGTYVLQSTATDEIPLQEENGTSGGALYSTKVFEIPTVTFK